MPVKAEGVSASFAAVVDSGTAAGNQSVHPAILVWAVVRLPLVALLVYALRHPILNVIEGRFDIFHVTRFVIDILSTPLSRGLTAGAFLAFLLVVAMCVRRRRAATGYLLLLAAALAALAVSIQFAVLTPRRSLPVLLLLAANLALASGAFLKRFPRVANTLMISGVAVVELMCLQHYWCWLRGGARGDSDVSRAPHVVWAAVPGLIIASGAFGIMVRGERLLPLEQLLRMPAEVQVLDSGLSFNWIELDPTGRYLYVTGHELPHLRRYDLQDLAAPPLRADVSTGGAQGFAYDPQADEIYALNTASGQLLYLDASTLEVRRAVPVPDLSPGDPWVAVDPVTDTLTVVSEADLQVGVPFMVLRRGTGEVLAREDLDAGNILKHPEKPWLYLTFFRRRSELVLYDLERRAVAHVAPADPRAERMVFWRAQDEVLVTSPMESRVLRFGADPLQARGHMSALFGVRAIALDERRNLLLCGNIATGHLVVLDLNSGRRLRSYYLGPWLRTIQLHVDSATAYVSSNGALYRLRYGSEQSLGRGAASAMTLW